MPERIYNLTGQGVDSTLHRFEEEPFDEEGALQELIAHNPDLLSGEQMDLDNPPRFMLVGREVPIADREDGAGRWALDLLLTDQNAVPTLVETKLSANPEIRRTIVGQMLEYAAHASKYWTAAELRERFEENEDADLHLSELIDQEDPDPEEFWSLVETNLNAKKLRLLFVADRIPDELATVVEFLNMHLPRTIEVLAVEIKQFRGDHGRILVPQVIGRMAAASKQSSKPRLKLNRETFLAGLGDPRIRAAAEELLDVAEAHGGTLSWGTSAVSIRVEHRLWPLKRVTLAWLSATPDLPGWNHVQDFCFGNAVNQYRNVISEDSPLVVRLHQWADEFSNDSFTNRLEDQDLNAWWVAHEDAPAQIETLKRRLANVLDDLANL